MTENIVDILDAWLASRLETVHTALPGQIEQYYGHAQRKARVKSLVKLRTRRGEEVEIPAIDNVPVVFPGSRQAQLLFPLARGDGCLILFAEEAIGNFLAGSREVAPEDGRRFSLTDAICIPGLWSFRSSPTAPARENSLYLRFRKAELELDAGSLIGLRNEVANLKAELEKVWNEVKALNDLGVSWKGVVDGSSCTPDAATLAQYNAGAGRSATNKTDVGKLLRS